jgi:hypothetical protein
MYIQHKLEYEVGFSWKIDILSNVLSDETSKGCNLPYSVIVSMGDSEQSEKGLERELRMVLKVFTSCSNCVCK